MEIERGQSLVKENKINPELCAFAEGIEMIVNHYGAWRINVLRIDPTICSPIKLHWLISPYMAM